jgi:Ca-activated chloride channel family protein
MWETVFSGFELLRPEALYLLMLIPALIVLRIVFRKRRLKWFSIPDFHPYHSVKPALKQRLNWIPFLLRIIALCSLVIALSSPNTVKQVAEPVEGISIALAIDVSKSMLTDDILPNRLEAAIANASRFIDKRKNDKISLTAFAARAITLCPLTLDHDVLKNILNAAPNLNLPDGTAIGDAIVNAAARLKDDTSSTKIVLLITDGESNAGIVAPEEASAIAALYGIKVYSIVIGEMNSYENLKLLMMISGKTNGKFYSANGNSALADIINVIDKLEKTHFEPSFKAVYYDLSFFFLIIALMLLFTEQILSRTMFRVIQP